MHECFSNHYYIFRSLATRKWKLQHKVLPGRLNYYVTYYLHIYPITSLYSLYKRLVLTHVWVHRCCRDNYRSRSVANQCACGLRLWSCTMGVSRRLFCCASSSRFGAASPCGFSGLLGIWSAVAAQGRSCSVGAGAPGGPSVSAICTGAICSADRRSTDTNEQLCKTRGDLLSLVFKFKLHSQGFQLGFQVW
jgi:hypothetical protein